MLMYSSKKLVWFIDLRKSIPKYLALISYNIIYKGRVHLPSEAL